MIIECNSCSRKFLVKDRDIPRKGRMVQCSYCSQQWFQTPAIKKRAKRKIVQEIEIESIEKTINPSSGQINNEIIDQEKQSEDMYKRKHGLGFFGYIFLLIIIAFSIIGVLETFQNELLVYFPASEYIFETMDNMILIIQDLIKSY